MEYKLIKKGIKARVLTVGVFDLYHEGHLQLFIEASKLGDLFVAVNSDEFVERYKGKKPIIPLNERIDMVRSCKFVRHAFENYANEDLRPLIEKNEPKYLVVGSDWLDKDYFKQTKLDTNFLNSHNVTLVYVPRSINQSSSNIKRKILNEG